MLVLGLVLLLVGIIIGIKVLAAVGIVALIVGAVLAFAEMVGRPFAGRRWY